MLELSDLLKKIMKFRDDRDWKQFHNPKDMSLSLVLEAGEVMEHFQWKNTQQVEEYIKDHKEEIGEELADVFYWILLLSHDMEIDLLEALDKKIDTNAKKYPVGKSKGNAKKYDKL